MKVITNVYNSVGQKLYGFQPSPIHMVRRPGKPRTQHNSKLCQACADRICTEASRQQGYGVPSTAAWWWGNWRPRPNQLKDSSKMLKVQLKCFRRAYSEISRNKFCCSLVPYTRSLFRVQCRWVDCVVSSFIHRLPPCIGLFCESGSNHDNHRSRCIRLFITRKQHENAVH